jgi:hypothetical protein
VCVIVVLTQHESNLGPLIVVSCPMSADHRMEVSVEFDA